MALGGSCRRQDREAGRRIPGPRFIFFSSAGTYLRSIAPDGRPEVIRRSETAAARLLRALPNGRLLAVPWIDEYVVRVWEVAGGRLVRELRREAPWFSEQDGPFRPVTTGLWVDPAGRVWTLFTVRDPDWRRGVRPKLIEGIEPSFEILDRDRVFDSVIEVIDLERGCCWRASGRTGPTAGSCPGACWGRSGGRSRRRVRPLYRRSETVRGPGLDAARRPRSLSGRAV